MNHFSTKLLSQPIQIGQGGRWEANADQIYMALVRLEALLSSFLAREIKQTFGERGTRDRSQVSRWLRSFPRHGDSPAG